MEDKITVVGRLQSKTGVLEHPELFTDVPLIILHIRDAYMLGLTAWAETHDIRDLELTIREKQKDATQRAWHFFFALRDRLAKKTEGENATRSYKEHLYRSAVRELGIRKEGKLVDSLKDLDKRETWICTELLH